jgi:hypothetical protein
LQAILGGAGTVLKQFMKAGMRGTLRGFGKFALTSALSAALSAIPVLAAPAGPIQVDVKLVIATDMSRSIDAEEAQIQRQGVADVFLDPAVIATIEKGSLGVIAVAMLDWSGYRDDRVVLDWTLVHNKASAMALAEKIRKLPTIQGQRTSISSALEHATAMLNDSDNEIVGTRKVIDVSGDGPNNDGTSLQHIHDATKDNGIVVNGLPIMDEKSDGYFADLDVYYGACVVAGKGAFLLPVKRFKDFGAAMRRKLVLEIAGNESPIRQAAAGFPNPLFLPIAATTVQRGAAAPAAKTYPGGCDKYGGWGGDGP